MQNVRFSSTAQADLEAIGDYIAQDSPARALTFIAELRQQCHKIATRPLAYRSRSDISKGLRSCPYGNYVIFFLPRAIDVLIVRILHGAQDIYAQFRE